MANSGAGSKADAAVKLVLVFFVSLLSFSVGTFVGKKVSDANHRRADLENEYPSPSAERGVASVEAATPDTEAVTDEEVAALTKEFVEAERKLASTADPAKAAAAGSQKDGYTRLGGTAEPVPEKKEDHGHHQAHDHAKVDPAKKNDGLKKAADRVAKDMSPSKGPKKARKPSTALPGVATTAIGKYTVQVASHGSEAEAREQVNSLKEKGYSAFYVPADVKGQTWYRVSIGLFTDQKSATNYRAEVLKSRAVSSAIVARIVK